MVSEITVAAKGQLSWFIMFMAMLLMCLKPMKRLRHVLICESESTDKLLKGMSTQILVIIAII